MKVVQEFYIKGLRYRIYENHWGGYCTMISIDNIEQHLNINEKYLPTVAGCHLAILKYLHAQGSH